MMLKTSTYGKKTNPKFKFDNKLSNSRTTLSIHKEIIVWIICLLISSSLMLMASRSSPIYPLNDWVDANTFFTVGKGMMRGKVPYRDLFEQKGPLLHLIYGIASLISYDSFLGVYILESISFSIFLFYGQKILSLYVTRKFALLTLPILAASVLNLRSFAYGGTAESFTLPFLMASLFYSFDYFRSHYPEPPSLKWGFIQGLLAGCVLWIKYSFLGFWLGWLAMIIASGLINKNFLHMLKFCGVFLAGLLTPTLPWIVYFGVNGAIYDWLQTYFVINLTAYSGDHSLLEIVHTGIDSYQRHLQFNPLAISFISFGLLLFVTLKQFKKSWWFNLGLLLSIGMLALGVYAGGRDYIYYFLIFAPYLILGFTYLIQLYQQNYDAIPSNLLFSILLFLSLFFSLAYTYRFNRNSDFIFTGKEELAQYSFAEIINQSEDQSLFNYGFGDGGFYTTTGTLPTVKYFQKINIDYGNFPTNMDEQNRYIREKVTEFVVTRYLASEGAVEQRNELLKDYYQRIKTKSQYFGEQDFIYALYKRR